MIHVDFGSAQILDSEWLVWYEVAASSDLVLSENEWFIDSSR